VQTWEQLLQQSNRAELVLLRLPVLHWPTFSCCSLVLLPLLLVELSPTAQQLPRQQFTLSGTHPATPGSNPFKMCCPACNFTILLAPSNVIASCALLALPLCQRRQCCNATAAAEWHQLLKCLMPAAWRSSCHLSQAPLLDAMLSDIHISRLCTAWRALAPTDPARHQVWHPATSWLILPWTAATPAAATAATLLLLWLCCLGVQSVLCTVSLLLCAALGVRATPVSCCALPCHVLATTAPMTAAALPNPCCCVGAAQHAQTVQCSMMQLQLLGLLLEALQPVPCLLLC